MLSITTLTKANDTDEVTEQSSELVSKLPENKQLARYYVREKLIADTRNQARLFLDLPKTVKYTKVPTVVLYRNISDEKFDSECWVCDDKVVQFIPETNEIWTKGGASAQEVFQELIRAIYYNTGQRPGSEIYESWVTSEVRFLSIGFLDYKVRADRFVPNFSYDHLRFEDNGTSILDMPAGP